MCFLTHCICLTTKPVRALPPPVLEISGWAWNLRWRFSSSVSCLVPRPTLCAPFQLFFSFYLADSCYLAHSY
ncbi:hypothetical protein B0H14DRAFT_2728213 [Mycena olivaceomarginata]|nr:hypothetical protein B0H14DRAFT_2728213 [Mycena olivaceomarginata]